MAIDAGHEGSRSAKTAFEVTDCDLKDALSSAVNWSMKSSGNRFRFRRTAWFSTFVWTPYICDKSLSRMTLWPRIRSIAPFDSLVRDQQFDFCHLLDLVTSIGVRAPSSQFLRSQIVTAKPFRSQFATLKTCCSLNG